MRAVRNIIAFYFFLISLGYFQSFAQVKILTVDSLDIAGLPSGSISYLWLHMTDDGLGQPISVPVIIAKGKLPGHTLGLTAAIHGNELNGIPIIQAIIRGLDVDKLSGIVVAIPGLNPPSIKRDSRRFVDDEDLNRMFPGKEKGNQSQQFVWQITQKILPHLHYLVDMHTASFGRENTFYVRADLEDSLLWHLATVQPADIFLSSKGPTAGATGTGGHSLREEATLRGIPCLTIEYGNPQVFQQEMIERGIRGIQNILIALAMVKGEMVLSENEVIHCVKSYWLYVDQGGLLTVPVALNEVVEKQQLIGILKDPFGNTLKKYYAPERGIVIGKSTNPVNMSGGRIIHLGIIKP